MEYRVAEVMLFTTCNYACGYCNYALGGAAHDREDLKPFQDREYIRKVFDFFERHSDGEIGRASCRERV